MDKILICLLLFCVACKSDEEKVCEVNVVASHDSGILSYGTKIKLTSNSNEKVYYEFNGKVPNEHSKFFRGELEFVHKPSNNQPLWSLIRTTVDDIDKLPTYFSPKNEFVATDEQFKWLKSVYKHTTLSLKSENCDRVIFYQWIDSDKFKLHNNVPIVSIFADPNELYGKSGILVEGDKSLTKKVPVILKIISFITRSKKRKGFSWNDLRYDKLYGYSEDELEKKAATLISLSNGFTYSHLTKIELAGENSSFLPNKSVSIKFPKSKRLKLNGLFPNVDEFRSVYLRTRQKYMIIDDVFANRLLLNQNIGAQNSVICALYINGEFNGIRHFCEKQNDAFVKTHYDIGDAELARFSYGFFNLSVVGNSPKEINKTAKKKYKKLVSILKKEDKGEQFYDQVNSVLNTETFFKARFASSFLARWDKGLGNTRLYWSTKDSIFYEMIKDYDNIMLYDAIDSNYLQRFYEQSKDYPQRSLIMSNLLINNQFKNQFLGIASDMLSTCFTTEHMLTTLESCKNELQPHIDLENARWGHISISRLPRQLFYGRITEMKDFIVHRRSKVINQIMNDFNVDTTSVSFQTMSTSNNNFIKISGVKTDSSNLVYRKLLFENVPVLVEAVGEGFIGWNNVDLPQKFTFVPQKDSIYNFTAMFEN